MVVRFNAPLSSNDAVTGIKAGPPKDKTKRVAGFQSQKMLPIAHSCGLFIRQMIF